MPGIDIAPLASYLPLVDKNVTEKFRVDRRGDIPLAMVIGEQRVSAGIDETFKTDFQLAISSKDTLRLQDLLDADPSQYNCSVLLLLDSLKSQRPKLVDNLPSSEKQIKRVELVQASKEIIKSIPGGEKLVKSILNCDLRTTCPLASTFLDQYKSGTGELNFSDSTRIAMIKDVELLDLDKFNSLESEISQQLDTVNRLAFWKATIATLLIDDGAIIAGLEPNFHQSRIDYRTTKNLYTNAGELNIFLRRAISNKLVTINFINKMFSP